ncbi:hypothetical protein I3760_14G078000 [Carya illinoinensis]|nr:hypothetical protein I3760_14G078000 [Carya illinoinensis]
MEVVIVASKELVHIPTVECDVLYGKIYKDFFGGTIIEQPTTVGGSGTSYLYGFFDQAWTEGMTPQLFDEMPEKNLMTIFQLFGSIFIRLVSRFRVRFEAKIGLFFPIVVMRVLENIFEPNFQQKMIVLQFLEKLRSESQILVEDVVIKSAKKKGSALVVMVNKEAAGSATRSVPGHISNPLLGLPLLCEHTE